MKTFRNAFRIYLGGTYAKKNYNKNIIVHGIFTKNYNKIYLNYYTGKHIIKAQGLFII